MVPAVWMCLHDRRRKWTKHRGLLSPSSVEVGDRRIDLPGLDDESFRRAPDEGEGEARDESQRGMVGRVEQLGPLRRDDSRRPDAIVEVSARSRDLNQVVQANILQWAEERVAVARDDDVAAFSGEGAPGEVACREKERSRIDTLL